LWWSIRLVYWLSSINIRIWSKIIIIIICYIIFTNWTTCIISLLILNLYTISLIFRCH
jgi:hypothetical protein